MAAGLSWLHLPCTVWHTAAWSLTHHHATSDYRMETRPRKRLGGSAGRFAVVTLFATIAALVLVNVAVAAPPVLLQVGATGGKATASWVLPPGVKARFVEVSMDPTTESDGSFICCGHPYFDNDLLDDTQTTWTGSFALGPGTYYVHVSGIDLDCFVASACPVREWTQIMSFTFGAAGDDTTPATELEPRPPEGGPHAYDMPSQSFAGEEVVVHYVTAGIHAPPGF